jgi:hypothetical protein
MVGVVSVEARLGRMTPNRRNSAPSREVLILGSALKYLKAKAGIRATNKALND